MKNWRKNIKFPSMISVVVVAIGLLILYALIITFNGLMLSISLNDYITMSKSSQRVFRYPFEERYMTSPFTEDIFDGIQYTPIEIKKKGVVVVFNDFAETIETQLSREILGGGYEVYSISYYGYACKNKTINEIPLDAFKNMFDEISNTCADNSAITVIGKGKGAELALNLANYYPEINNLILYSPSSYNFQSLDSNGKQTYSSWTYNGKPVEYIDFSKNSFINKSINFISSKLSFPQSYIGDYKQAIKKANNLESARIKTDSFNGNILMFAGEKDKYWNSSEMASVIYENHPNKDKIEVITYENAGHNFLTDKHYNLVTYGGNYENNFSAHIDSAKIAKEKLALWHPNV